MMMEKRVARSIGVLVIASSSLLLLMTNVQAAVESPSPRPRNNLAPRLRSQGGTGSSVQASRADSEIRAKKAKENATLSVRSIPSSGASSSRLQSFVEDELPADFYEMPPEQLDLGMNATGRAPVPILNVAVLQNGQVIDSAINVHPGTPLEMVIYLDDKSAKVYGLVASYLKVQDDTFRQREEDIIRNGCSIDTYIFGNFEHNPEDQSLRAKFRAFKFPESNFVRFVGTVNVCIAKCNQVNCSGSRRKRSAIKDINNNKLVMTVSTVLRITDTTEPRRQR